MRDKKLLGKIGEDMAEAMLFSEGYSILARNFRSYFGEIDIVCEKDDVLYFVEVKTRTSETFGDPEEAVDDLKKYRIRKTAEYYLLKGAQAAKKDVSSGTPGYIDIEPEMVFKVMEIMVRETDDSFLM